MRHRLSILLVVWSAACAVERQPDDGAVPDRNVIAIHDLGLVDAPTVSCPPGRIACDGSCTRVAADPLNCGSCGNVCPTHVGCANGECSCMAPRLPCDGICADATSDHDHCGACDHACAATEMCSLGECIPRCTATGFAVCVETDPSTHERTQVCVDRMNDAAHCGSCGNRCGEGAECVAGLCTCTSGSSCMGSCVDLMTDPLHCGTCYWSCGEGGVCVDGTCTTCSGGLTRCGSPAHCVDLQSNVLYCGACDVTCPIGAACTEGHCACPSGRTACDGECVDTSHDDANCGRCGHVCPATSTCLGGSCVCAAGGVDCGDVCATLDTDALHCGDCGNSCGLGGLCDAGHCTCGPGFAMCGGTHCARLADDPQHCGDCDHPCAMGEVCRAGACSAPPTHYVASVPSATDAPWIDACALPDHMDALLTTDDGSTRVALPFPFRYWTTDLPEGALVNLSSNGWLGMDGTPGSTTSGTIPSTRAPTSVIAPHWGDLYTGTTGVCIATIGDAPLRQIVFDWGHASYPGDTGRLLTFEVVLSETTGTIDFIYEAIRGAHEYTEGIEDATGTMAVGGCGDTTYTCTPESGMRVRFTPIP